MEMYKISLTLIVVMLLSACGSSGGGGSGDKQGVFLDAAVEGIRFVTNSRSGTTDANGGFTYQQGETISFYVGDILLGSTTAQATITPVDMVAGASDETNPQVTNIVRFLLTLDLDGNFTNGITINSAVISAAASQSIDFSLSIAAFENDSSVLAVVDFLTQGFQGGARSLVSTANAQAHFRDTLNGMRNGGTDIATGNFGTLAISGADTGTIGTSFSPNVAFFDTRQSVINPSAINTTLSWLSNSGTAFSATANTGNINVSIIDGNLTQILFAVVTPNSSQSFSYVLSCSIDPAECNKLTIDLSAKTASFNNIKIFNQPGVSSAIGDITLSNTLTWQ